MTTERQMLILGLVIDEYVKDGKPISSQQILDSNPDVEVSSALIRAEMLSLEKEGYIEKAYKSAGRIPTNKAFEYYITNIKEDSREQEVLFKRLDEILDNREQSIEKNLSVALSYINELTNTLSVFRDKTSDEKLEDLKVYSISNEKAMILIVTNFGSIFNNEIYIGSLPFKDLEVMINMFSERLKGTILNELESKASNLKDLIITKVKTVERKYQEFIRMIFNNVSDNKSSYAGTNSLIQSTHIDNKNLTKILGYIETQTIWDILSKTKSIEKGNTSVSIEVEGLEGISVINKQLILGDRKKQIALVGSKKQDYKKVIGLLDRLEEKLKE